MELPFPSEDRDFPADLGAIVQRSVLDGIQPARVVIHDADNDWLVGDGMTDPNAPDACVVARLRHIADRDPTVADLVSLPAGHIAERDDEDASWRISLHRYPDD